MILINFAHPITERQKVQIEMLTDQPITRIIDQPTQMDETQPFTPQVEALLAELGISASEWQSLPILINLPSYAPAIACLLAMLHGYMGHFPAVIRVRPVVDSTPRQYEVAEVMNLQAVREDVRRARST